jgi:hypothetical protein
MKDLKLSLIVQALDRATAPLRAIGGGLKGLEERAEHLGHSFKGLELASFLGGGLVIGAAAEAGKSLYELTDRVAETGEALLHSAIKSGATVEQMQRLSFAAKQLGVDQDGLSQVFFRFQTHLANGLQGQKETVQALKLLGISMRDAKRLSADPHEAFLRLVDGFSAIQNPTLRAKMAMDLFSRSGYQILPMLTAGREEIEKFENQLDAAHAVMTTEDAKASEEFIQKKNRMALVLQGLQMRIGVGLLPVMSRLVDKLSDVVGKLQPSVVTRFADSMGKLVDQLPALINLFSQLLDFVGWIVPRFMALSDQVGGLKTVLIILGGIMGVEFVANVITAVTAIGKFVALLRIMKGLEIAGAIISATGAIFRFAPALALATDAMFALDVAMDANPIGVIALAIGLVVAAVGALAFGVYELIKHWGQIGPFFAGLWAGVTKGVGVALTAISASVVLPVALVMKAWGGLTAWFANLMAGVEKAFADAWKRITIGVPAWLSGLLKAGGLALTVAGSPAAAAPHAPPPAPAHAPAPKPGASAPAHPATPRPSAAPPPKPMAKPPGAPAQAGAPTQGRVDVHVRLDQDGKVKDTKVKASGAGVEASASRGVLPA